MSLLDARSRRYALRHRSRCALIPGHRARASGRLVLGALGLVLSVLSESSHHLLHLREVILPQHVFLPDLLLLDRFICAVAVQQIL